MFSFEIAQPAFSTPQQSQQGSQSNIKVRVPLIKQLLPVHGLSTIDIAHVMLFLSWSLVHSPSCLLHPTNHLLSMPFCIEFSMWHNLCHSVVLGSQILSLLSCYCSIFKLYNNAQNLFFLTMCTVPKSKMAKQKRI